VLTARFDYQRPGTLDEALSMLDQQDTETKVLAGGMSLIPLMKLRFAAPARLVDLNMVPGLSGISESDGWLRVGSLARHADLERSDLLKTRYRAMAAAAPLVSDPLVRNRGTIGGSLAHADPAGDWGSVMLAMNARVAVRSTSASSEAMRELSFCASASLISAARGSSAKSDPPAGAKTAPNSSPIASRPSVV